MQTKNNKSRFKKYKKYFWIAVFMYIFLWLLSQDYLYQIWVVEQRYNIDIESKYIDSQPFYSPFRTNYTAMKVYLTDGSKQYDTFWITRKKNDFNILPNSVRDTYAGLAFRDKYEVYLKNQIKPYFDECKLYVDFSSDTLSPKITPDITVEEYLALNEDKYCEVEIYIPPEKYNEEEVTNISSNLCEYFKKLGVDSQVIIHRVSDGNLEFYNKINKYNRIQIISQPGVVERCFDDNYSFVTKEDK